MRAPLILLVVLLVGCTDPELARWQETAERVTITRDDWGIPHIYGPTDADAVFGMVYAQAEDDFNRVETNFINAMGRLAEAEGEDEIYRDLRMKLFIDPDSLRAMYDESPAWLVALMDAWADGLNYYLHTHPEVTPRVITRFEPWMALSFSEGSIGGDIERVSIGRLEEFYGGDPRAMVSAPLREAAGLTPPEEGPPSTALGAAIAEVFVPDEEFHAEPTGSNGFAIAPDKSATGEALLFINPHTSFFFRSELHMKSDEGLDAYGAVTWGQFFVYQGFNEDAGWMHTSSGVDNIDEFVEDVVEQDGALFYRYGDELRPVQVKEITVPYLAEDGSMAERTFETFRTHHGPIVRDLDGEWVAVAMMEEPMQALMQSYGRTKARNLADYRENMEMHTNSSNNTVYADSEGNIAYWHSNFIPRRDNRFDFTSPVDGSDPATDWDGVLSIEETPNVFNPPNGWLQNTNNWPFSAAGQFSPDQDDYPRYVQRSGENARGINAIRVLSREDAFTLQSLTDAAFDPYLSAFAEMIPVLVSAYDRTAASALKERVAEPLQTLREWDYMWGEESVPTTLAVYWAEQTRPSAMRNARDAGLSLEAYMASPGARPLLLKGLSEAVDTLAAHFGSWQTPWGEVNRFQRLTGDIRQPFSDDGPSIPVGFTSARWGSLASFGARTYPGTVRRYGTSGNSFVAAVAFGDSVRAMAVTAGGLSSDPDSPHFNDQAERYANGNLREVYYYPEQLEQHTEEVYHPGQR
ncbi:MAG: penicillin acylase family protein [Rhodothermales bacterium]|nr:penicillin acylase family protein [Rhodothermales bacterium]MBO6778151.1 penicillin acylase family protein [Rhodothermales bacterium]